MLLVSLKAAALGVNLTVANHVVLMDLWWNPTVEEQVGGSYRGVQDGTVGCSPRVNLTVVQGVNLTAANHMMPRTYLFHSTVVPTVEGQAGVVVAWGYRVPYSCGWTRLRHQQSPG